MDIVANDDGYVGKLHERQNLFLKLVEKKFIISMNLYLYTFKDRKGNVVKSWVKPEKHDSYEFVEGDCLDMDAYVNRHTTNKYENGQKETMINRIKIIENKGQKT